MGTWHRVVWIFLESFLIARVLSSPFLIRDPRSYWFSGDIPSPPFLALVPSPLLSPSTRGVLARFGHGCFYSATKAFHMVGFFSFFEHSVFRSRANFFPFPRYREHPFPRRSKNMVPRVLSSKGVFKVFATHHFFFSFFFFQLRAPFFPNN